MTNPLDSSPAAPPELPFVSVVMPVRNEASYIANNLDILLSQDYPADRMEILVADGMSADGTREIISDYAGRDPRVRLLDNPGQIVPTGLNAAIKSSRGEFIIRVDGHGFVAPDFIRQNVALLEEHPEAWCVGGPIIHIGTNTFGKAVAIAQSHPLGVGNARHRFLDYEGYAEGALYPAFRRWVFDKIGYFDENLVRNQDDELNYRLGLAGGKVFVSPRVKFSYVVRNSVQKLFRQYFQYGFWRIPVQKKHRRPTSFRQTIPPLFYLAVAILFVLGLVLHQPWIAAALPLIYGLALCGAGIALIPKVGWKVALCVPLALATVHGGYALGYWWGVLAAALRLDAWRPSGSMAKLTR
ncbi:MAG TPA: glycosyltransferase family 2 protein [Pirellulales bacterium]|jgi:glycosyltransferase involved in cell wall biosynthesis|nr:glycosyltransferase family 2 protein [Pirellulales bacterium]